MKNIISSMLGVLILFIIVGILSAVPIWLLWNEVMPDIFNLTQITFWQALYISFLSKSLFNSNSNSNSSE